MLAIVIGTGFLAGTLVLSDSLSTALRSPIGKSMIRYTPWPSVLAVRTFSMSAGLVASTVTPGNTPPDESLTTPAMPLAPV